MIIPIERRARHSNSLKSFSARISFASFIRLVNCRNLASGSDALEETNNIQKGDIRVLKLKNEDDQAKAEFITVKL